MIKRVSNWTFSEITKFLKAKGFIHSHVKGSHYFYNARINHVARIVQVPFHGSKSLKPRTLKAIVVQSGIPLKDWLEQG